MKAAFRPILVCILFAVWAARLPHLYAASPGYQFTIIAQTGNTIAGKTLTAVSSPLINNAGTVVFSGDFAGGSGIFTPTDLLVQTGDTIASRTFTSISEFRLTDTGTLAFLAAFPGGSGIFTPSQVLVQTGDVIAGKTLTDFPYPPSYAYLGWPFAINNAGTLLFDADCQPPGHLSGGSEYPCQGIFTTSQYLALIARPYGDVFYSPFINDAGMLGVEFYSPDEGFFILSTNYGVSYLGDYISGPVINNSGALVFSDANGFSGSGAIVAPPRTLVSTYPFSPGNSMIGGRTLCDVLPEFPSMNNAGTVLFAAHFDVILRPQCASQGLFTTSELVFQTGDTIANKTIKDFSLSGFNLNDAGTIVFSATFTDGTAGIVMATPINTGVAGDVNGDGVVDCTDLAFVKASLGLSYGQAGFNPRADLNGDRIIDIRDLAFVAQHISTSASCP